MRLRRLLIFLLNLAAALAAPAQNPPKNGTPPPAVPAVPAVQPTAQAARLIQLRDYLADRDKTEKALKEARVKLKASATPEEKAGHEADEKRLTAELESLSAQLRGELTGITDAVLTSGDGEMDLEKQAREVLQPALDFMNDLMEQPREISKQQRAIERRKKELPLLLRAIEGLDRTLAEIDADREKAINAPLRAEVKKQRDELDRRRTVISSELEVSERRLEELLAERQGFGHYAAQLWSGFVLQRLLNILLAIAAFSGVLFLLRWVRRWLARRGLRKRMGASPFLARATDVLFHVLSVIAAIFSALVVLWISGDWLLLTLAMLVVAGLVLVSRHTVPRMYEQGRILLNLGGVREGERVIWHGLPWLVKRLHFSSILQNPSLTGGTVRLPLREMGQLLSRPSGQKERWFPTEEGDLLTEDPRQQRLELKTVATSPATALKTAGANA